jgi:hypothetical protein
MKWAARLQRSGYRLYGANRAQVPVFPDCRIPVAVSLPGGNPRSRFTVRADKANSLMAVLTIGGLATFASPMSR